MAQSRQRFWLHFFCFDSTSNSETNARLSNIKHTFLKRIPHTAQRKNDEDIVNALLRTTTVLICACDTIHKYKVKDSFINITDTSASLVVSYEVFKRRFRPITPSRTLRRSAIMAIPPSNLHHQSLLRSHSRALRRFDAKVPVHMSFSPNYASNSQKDT